MTSVLDNIRASLVGLKMPRALEALDHIMQRIEQGEITAIEAIDALLSEEFTNRETRRVTMALLPVKTIESFDFSFQPSLDKSRIMALAQLDFVKRAETVHFLGPPGTGKSHLATALGVACVKAGKSVYRATLAELIEALLKAEREGRLVEKLRFYTRAALLIVPSRQIALQSPAGQWMKLVTCRSATVAQTCSSSWSAPATKKEP